MGPRWAEICKEFTAKISQLGPSPIYLALQKNQAKKKVKVEETE
jgi:hypothetical protein